MRIALFTDTYRPSLNGVVVSIESFAAELRGLGCQVIVFAPRVPPHAWRRDRPSQHRPGTGIERVHWVRSVPFVFERSLRVGLPYVRRLMGIARSERLDLIHTQTPFQIGYAGIQVSRALGLPLVHTYHTYFAEYSHYLKAGARLGRLAIPRYSRWFCNLHDLIFTPSRDIARVLHAYGVRRPVEIFQTGVRVPPRPRAGETAAARSQLGLPPGSRLLLFVGRLAREKNLDLLLEAVARLRSVEPDLLLLLVGDGPDRRRLERRVRRLGLVGQVRFVGRIPNDRLRPWYAAADLFVFPSVTETQGLSVLEAMAHQRPVIAARGPGVREFLRPGRSGLLVDPTPERFAGAVHSLLDDPELSSKLAHGARRTAEQLDARRQAERLLERYRGLRGDCERTARRGLRGLAARAWEEAAAWR